MSVPVLLYYVVAGGIGLWMALKHSSTIVTVKCICGKDLYISGVDDVVCSRCKARFSVVRKNERDADIALKLRYGDKLYTCDTCKSQFIIPHLFSGIISCFNCNRSYVAQNKSNLLISPLRKGLKKWKNLSNTEREELMRALLQPDKNVGRAT